MAKDHAKKQIFRIGECSVGTFRAETKYEMAPRPILDQWLKGIACGVRPLMLGCKPFENARQGMGPAGIR